MAQGIKASATTPGDLSAILRVLMAEERTSFTSWTNSDLDMHPMAHACTPIDEK